mgnify:CR=1 FL=1
MCQNDPVLQTSASTILREDAALVEDYLNTLYPAGGRCDAVLDEAARYSLLAGGKRVRPALVLEFCRLFGNDPASALPFAAAVEMIHTFSLIHDDLPCMDDDDLRRGRPTNHKVYGEANALLAGDALALDAFGQISRAEGIPADVRVAAITCLSEAAGAAGMVRGQIMDMFGEEHALTYEELLTLHARKTGALIRVSAQLGCLSAGIAPGSPAMAAAEGYADRIGLVFQIVDDILDATSTAEALGKSVGGDAEHHKNTFLTFHTIPEATAEAERLTNEAIALISPYAGSERLAAIARALATRQN